ncbi:hypothetical protein ACFV5N_04585 [Streptomyces sp. NPDC059853]|uniref:hypothetical protein n=1 Tax=Streptomyces sp. NPDC059853 TaxID=3346973 RepID=UPI00364DB985
MAEEWRRSCAAAFPTALAADVAAVAAVMPAPRHGPAGPFPVVVQGDRLSIPGRLYNDEPTAAASAPLSARRRRLLHCLYSRHCDGRVRQRHLRVIAGATDPWVVPYVVQLAGEYGVEILRDLDRALRVVTGPGHPGRLVYGRFLADNPAFFDRTQRRVVSYWSCYHRLAYPDFHDYPGSAVIELLRSAASEVAGHAPPRLTPRPARRAAGARP